MKNIIIIGVGRTGKTTLSKLIKDKYYTYNVLHSDAIKWGMIRAEDRETYFRNNIGEQIKFERSEYFQKVLLELFNYSCTLNSYILESGQLEPKIISKIVDRSKTSVICLTHGNLTSKDILNLCLNNDTSEDWTFNMERSKLEAHCNEWYRMNEFFKEECDKHNILNINTSTNRDRVLEAIISRINN